MGKRYTLQAEFLNQLVEIRNYALKEERWPTAQEKVDGALFSLLVLIDGMSAAGGPYELSIDGVAIWGDLHDGLRPAIARAEGQEKLQSDQEQLILCIGARIHEKPGIVGSDLTFQEIIDICRGKDLFPQILCDGRSFPPVITKWILTPLAASRFGKLIRSMDGMKVANWRFLVVRDGRRCLYRVQPAA